MGTRALLFCAALTAACTLNVNNVPDSDATGSKQPLQPIASTDDVQAVVRAFLEAGARRDLKTTLELSDYELRKWARKRLWGSWGGIEADWGKFVSVEASQAIAIRDGMWLALASCRFADGRHPIALKIDRHGVLAAWNTDPARILGLELVRDLGRHQDELAKSLSPPGSHVAADATSLWSQLEKRLGAPMFARVDKGEGMSALVSEEFAKAKVTFEVSVDDSGLVSGFELLGEHTLREEAARLDAAAEPQLDFDRQAAP